MLHRFGPATSQARLLGTVSHAERKAIVRVENRSHLAAAEVHVAAANPGSHAEEMDKPYRHSG